MAKDLLADMDFGNSEDSEKEKSEPEDLYHASTIVIEPGSKYIRFGLATDVVPQTDKHVLARKRKIYKSKIEKICEVEELVEDDEENFEVDADGDDDNVDLSKRKRTKRGKQDRGKKKLKTKNNQKIIEPETEINQMIKRVEVNYKRKTGFKKRPISAANITAFNLSYHPEVIPEHLDDLEIPWIDVNADDCPRLLTGEEIFLVENDEVYEIIYPIKNGYVNSKEYSDEFLKSTLFDIWTSLIEKKLKIPPTDLQDYQIVLVVPNITTKRHVKLLCSVAVDLMKCKALLVHQEAVCATFGGGVPSACVVDIGAQKTSIDCVEDGHLLSGNRVKLHYGSDDVTRVFYHLLKKIEFPYRDLNLNCHLDWNLLEEMQQKYCHLDEDLIKTETKQFFVRRPGCKSQKFMVKFAEEAFRASLVLFYCKTKLPVFQPVDELDPQDILEDITSTTPSNNARGTKKEDKSVPRHKCKYGECKKEFNDITKLWNHLNGDHMDGFRCQWADCSRGKKPFANKSVTITHFKSHVNVNKANNDDGDSDSSNNINIESDSNNSDNKIRTSPMDLIGAIKQSISSLSEEGQQKMLNCVLLAGGGLLINEFSALLQSKLQDAFPKFEVKVLVNPKDIESPIISWKGASILAQLDQASEFWVSPEEWHERDLNAVREICPLIFV